MINAEKRPGLKAAINEQDSFYEQHARAISDATNLLKTQLASIT